jgi:alkylation response protein AidB-like acyl-CoA dehydrogenase
MDVRLSPEQVALRDSAAQMLDRLAPRSVRDLDDTERKTKLDAAVEASGWRDLRVASDGRNPLASAVEAAIIAEELGRALADTAFLGPTLASDLRRRTGAGAPQGRESVALVPDLTSPAEAPATGAVVVDSDDATSALVLLRSGSGSGWGLAAAALGAAGNQVDLTRAVAAVGGAEPARLADAVELLMDDDVLAWWALGLALTCADLVGVMRGVIDLATDYAASRRQYGVPVGSFQAVQHMLADALVAMEGSRSTALHAAWAVDALAPTDALVAASVAKAYCVRAARSVCETGIQVHGGMGNTWDCLAHVFLRRALLSSDILGGVGASLARVLAHRGIGEANGLR